MKVILLLLFVILAGGCAVTQSDLRAPDVTVISPAGEKSGISDIVIRKSRKYGINPNLLHAVVAVELANSERSQIDVDGAEWVCEQTAKVLRHILSRTRSVALAADYYATGNFSISQDMDSEERRLSSAIVREFKRREKLSEWKGAQ